jgi:iron-sulfur cluster assembly accessory protein
MPEILKLTPKALEQAKALLSKEAEPKEGLRVAVIGGGCSGLQYKLGWDDSKETDQVHNYQNGLAVMVDEKSALFLLDSTLEYKDGLDGGGFEVINPNAQTTCGCGKSFS